MYRDENLSRDIKVRLLEPERRLKPMLLLVRVLELLELLQVRRQLRVKRCQAMRCHLGYCVMEPKISTGSCVRSRDEPK